MAHGKYKASKPVGGTQFGATIHDSDPAKFKGAGKTTGKSENGVVPQATGPVFTENSTHISAPNADKAAKTSKQLNSSESTVNIDEHDGVCDLTASQSGSGSPTDRPYPLKKSYEKGGKGSSKSARAQR